MTQLTFDFSRALAKTWQPGDEVNVTPGSRREYPALADCHQWAGAVVREEEFDPAAVRLAYETAPSGSPTGLGCRGDLASDLIGTRPRWLGRSPRWCTTPALFYVDGVHSTAQGTVDVTAIGADSTPARPINSPGRTAAVLAGRVSAASRDEKLLRQPISSRSDSNSAICRTSWLAGSPAQSISSAAIGPDSLSDRTATAGRTTLVEEHEDRLRWPSRPGGRPGRCSRLLSPPSHPDAAPAHLLAVTRWTPTSPRHTRHQRAAGSFFAIGLPIMGLGDTGGLRVGLAPYSAPSDVDRLLDGLAGFLG